MADRKLEAEIMRSIRDAPNHDVSALAARLVHTASKLDLMLHEGGEFKRTNGKALERLYAKLDGVKDAADKAKQQIAAQSTIRGV